MSEPGTRGLAANLGGFKDQIKTVKSLFPKAFNKCLAWPSENQLCYRTAGGPEINLNQLEALHT